MVVIFGAARMKKKDGMKVARKNEVEFSKAGRD